MEKTATTNFKYRKRASLRSFFLVLIVTLTLIGLIFAGFYFINKTPDTIINYGRQDGQERTKLSLYQSSGSLDPGDEREIGYEFVEDSVHIWNTQDSYFFDKDSGIQFTNHYEEYWTTNVFCLGYYNNSEWIKIKCADELTGFNRDIQTDNSTYVNATLWKDITYGSYDLRFGVQYGLELDDGNLSVKIYMKNIGIDIPFDLGFAWKIKDWDIPGDNNDDRIRINDTYYNLDGTFDLMFEDMYKVQTPKNETTGEDDIIHKPVPFIRGSDYTTFLRLDWDENLNYAVKMFGNGNQEDFYVMVLVDAGHFNPNQEKSTIFEWIDAEGDYIGSWDTNVLGIDPYGIAYGGTGDQYIYLNDLSGKTIDTVWPNGSATGIAQWSTAGECGSGGFDIEYYGGEIYLTCQGDDTQEIYSTAGVWSRSFSTLPGASADPSSSTTDGEFIWVVDETDNDVSKFNMTGDYESEIWASVGGVSGITTNSKYGGSNIWTSDRSLGQIHKYTMAGAVVSDFDTSGQGDGYGLTMSNDGVFYIVDPVDDEVYMYEAPIVILAAALNTTLSVPANDTHTNIQNITFNCSATDGVGVYNLTLVIGGIDNETVTNSTGGQNLSLEKQVNFTATDLDSNWTCRSADGDGEDTATERTFHLHTTIPTINFNLPLNQTYNHSSEMVNVTVIDTGGVGNCSYSLNGATNIGMTNTSNNWYNLTNFTLVSGPNYVTVSCNDSFNNTGSNTTYFMGMTTAPSITVNAPIGLLNFGETGYNETLNWSLTNLSAFDSVWWDYYETNTTLVGLSNQTEFILNNSLVGTVYANNTFGNINGTNTSWEYKMFINDNDYNTVTYEGASETYSINVTANTSLTAATLVWNGTNYAGSQAGSTWSRTIDIPTEIGSKSFYWDLTYDGFTTSSNTKTVSVSGTNFSICGGEGGSVPFLNFTFKDESDLSVINNGTIPSSTWIYWSGDGTENKSYSFTNNTGNHNYSFCSTPPDKELTVDYSIQYEDQEGTYVQRLFNPSSMNFSNMTTSRILYLLKATDGIYVTFQVIGPSETPIQDVIVTGTRVIGGDTVTVASGTTDAAGVVTFFLDGDFSHTFLFESESYDDYITSLFPTQSSYTISLGEGGTVDVDDYTQGINFQIGPTDSVLYNDTAYDFNMTITSSFWTVTEFGFVLFNSSDVEVDSASFSAAAGTVTSNYLVGNTTNYISMKYYYVIDGNYTNGSRNWYVLNSAGTDYSIRNFFTDFANYSDSGLFGLDQFGRAIIIFLIIFFFVGIMSYKFGLISPAGVSSLAFGIVLFFDVGLGLMGSLNPIDAVPNFPTIFMGLVLAGILFREVYR